MDSLMGLASPWSFLPMVLKLVSVVLCPVCCICEWIGEGCLRCSLHLSPRVLAVSPCTPHCRLYDCTRSCRLPHFFVLWVLVLGFHEDLLDCGVALEVNLYAILTTCVFETFHQHFCVWYDYISNGGIWS